MLLNSKKFKQISFFLGGKKEVNSLEEGAKKIRWSYFIRRKILF